MSTNVFCIHRWMCFRPRLNIYERFKENANTWKRCLLDKLKDSIKFQASPGSESKSQNTWKVWLLSLLIVYNPEAVDPAAS